jgi:NDP-sugar pyrophosphorylase family protein
MKAMILAAGLGTRLGPLTNSKPKALIEINGICLLELLIERLKSFGFDEIIVNVHHFSEQIINFLNTKKNFGIRIEISEETELLDTGGGLKKAAWFFDDHKSFLLHNVDVITDLDYTNLLSQHIDSNALATLAVRSRKTRRYFLSDENNNLCGWHSLDKNEKKIARTPKGELRQVSFMGIHVISPEIFSIINIGDRFSIIESYLKLAANHQIKVAHCDKARWLDLGTLENLKEAPEIFPNLHK